MSLGNLHAPGTPGGPCRERRCHHADCAATRKIAARICRLCSHTIGYQRDFLLDDGRYVHLFCADAVARKGASKVKAREMA